ncbi:MAG: hypothetical protein ACK4MF_08540 [Hyphomicrobiaceae bacterium]
MPHRAGRGIGLTMAPPRRPERTLAVALIAIVAFNQPLLRLFDQGAQSTIAGLPVIYVYLFSTWALVIALLAAAIEAKPRAPVNGDAAEVTTFVDGSADGPATIPGRPPRDDTSRGDPAER